MKTALILVDIQMDYFEGGLFEVPEMVNAARQAAALLAHARRHEWPIMHIRHEAASESAPFFRPGTPGAEIAPVVAPVAGEPVLVKHRPNSFLGTDLEALLRAEEVGRVVIAGAMSQMCIDATARAARDLGFDVTVAADACAARSVRHGGTEVPAAAVHAAFMGALAMSYATVTPVAEITR